MSRIKEDVDRLFDFNYLPSQRLIYVGSQTAGTENEEGESGTDCRMAEFFLKAMIHLSNISNKPIIVHMNNIGGNWYHGMAMFDAIRMSRCHVYGIAWGYATSMGSVIFQACDSRIIAPNCVFMIHDGDITESGTCKAVEAWIKYSIKTRKQLYSIYYSRMRAARPRITLDKIENMCSHDTVLSAEQAVSYGFADWVMERLDDPYKFFATNTQNDKWTPGMTSTKHEIENEYEIEEK